MSEVTPTTSALLFASTLSGLDKTQERLGLPTVANCDLSWAQRAEEVYVRLHEAVSGDGSPSLELIEVAGAHLLALHGAAFAAQVVRPESGDEELGEAA